jgi:Zn-dependent protease
MNLSWKLGRFAGIDLFLHPSFLLLFLPGLFPEVSAFFLIAVFACVVLHEYGHALMARRFGIDTLDITLYPIGGVARLQRMPKAPGAELLIALAGPAVNFAIVGVLMALGWAGLLSLNPTTAGGSFLASLMMANLVLGLFNLIPAFPMDGGRVLRALLSGWLGRPRATSIAASVGRALAVAFGLYALTIPSFFQVALAVFIYLAAGIEEAGVWAEARRRGSTEPPDNRGIWAAPPGYTWVNRGDGVWQLSPITVSSGNGPRPQASSPWAS